MGTVPRAAARLAAAAILAAGCGIASGEAPAAREVRVVVAWPREGGRVHAHAGESVSVAGSVEGAPAGARVEAAGGEAPMEADGTFVVALPVASDAGADGLREGENRVTVRVRADGLVLADLRCAFGVETRCAAPPGGPEARGIENHRGAFGRPVRINARTRAMLEQARRYYGGPGVLEPRALTQGSYSTAVEASAGTHDGGGVIDLTVRDPSGLREHLPDAEIEGMVAALRAAGFAAWYRRPPLFPKHIHAVAVGDPDLADHAREQLTGRQGYFRGRDGLRQAGPDGHGGPVLCDWMRAAGYADLRVRDEMPEGHFLLKLSE